MDINIIGIPGVRRYETHEKYFLVKISVGLSARVLHVSRTDIIAFSLLGMKLSA